MLLLIAFSFLAGVVTILSPCILPVLPIILTSTIGGKDIGKGRPLGVVTGFILSFTFFTLFLSTLVRISGISADSLRFFSIVVIASFGLSLLIPQFQVLLEKLFSKLTSIMPSNTNRQGFSGGLFIGFSLGLLWTPCVGPILASVISLAITGSVTFDAFLITLAYSIGTALPMFLVMLGGQQLLRSIPWLLRNTSTIQKIFGVVMILTAIAIFFNVDRRFQSYILTVFPNYGTGLTKFEDNEVIKKQLDKRSDDQSLFGRPSSELLSQGRKAPDIIPGGVWFNTAPLSLSKLKGKVVLIDFWTYSCINCQRTLPYLRSWHEKYKDKGLTIIGVHSPEFEFEKSEENVQQALTDFMISYPVVQDNDFATWSNYNNRYWPAKYLIDKDGFIRYEHFGEGAYDETEAVIQELLKETGATDVTNNISNPSYDIAAKTPELYLGFGRIDHFSSPETIKENTLATYSVPKSLGDNQLAYEGEWEVMEEYANPKKGAKLHLSFEAKEVFLVMRSKTDTSEVSILLDGKKQFLGKDVIDGIVTITEDTLYRLINLPKAGKHTLLIEFEDDNTEVYAFTFG